MHNSQETAPIVCVLVRSCVCVSINIDLFNTFFINGYDGIGIMIKKHLGVTLTRIDHSRTAHQQTAYTTELWK